MRLEPADPSLFFTKKATRSPHPGSTHLHTTKDPAVDGTGNEPTVTIGDLRLSQVSRIEMPPDWTWDDSFAAEPGDAGESYGVPGPRQRPRRPRRAAVVSFSEIDPEATGDTGEGGGAADPECPAPASASALPEEDLQEEKKNDAGEDELDLTPRAAVLRAERRNAAAGHECAGYLSFSHGFAPRVVPPGRFPPAFGPWNDLADALPRLLSSRKLRQYCDDPNELPVLDASTLPPAFAIRAANVLGIVAHAYWNLGIDPPKSRRLPPGLEEPWIQVNRLHLGRDGTHFLGFLEHVAGNFRFEEGGGAAPQPPPPEGVAPCPWITDEMAGCGCREYDPARAGAATCVPGLWLTGIPAERHFFGVLSETQTAGAPVVRIAVELQEAAAGGDVPAAKARLKELLDLLHLLTFDVFGKIQQQRKAPHFVDPTVWSRIVAPLTVPITKTSVGPSGTATPVAHLLDALLGRTKYEEFIGKENRGLFEAHPRNWKEFLEAVQRGPSVVAFVDRSGDRELQGLLGACLQQYAGENGFLGRHKLKMLG